MCTELSQISIDIFNLFTMLAEIWFDIKFDIFRHVIEPIGRSISNESVLASVCYFKIPMNSQRPSLPSQHVMCCKYEVLPDFLEKG